MVNMRQTNPIIMFIVLAVALGGIYYMTYLNSNTPCSQAPIVTKTDIYSLNDEAILQGKFILGSGYIVSHPVYVYYEQISGGYMLKTAPAVNSIIYMDQEIEPYVVVSEWKCAPISYIFHIPNNSVVHQYNLDSNL
jgi:hypothetical protein